MAMLSAIADIFDRAFTKTGSGSEPSREHTLQFAAAILLVEVARADFAEDLSEDHEIRGLLKEFFSLTDEETALLVADAKAEADHTASLQAFTRRLHEELTVPEKHGIVEMLWKVALADEHLDKHEDHLVRKIAGLLYVSHGDLIRIRNRVDPSHG
jgi:uncharacterized tellurite resistance protein B-like protein